jgi:hypothetical protein
MGFELYAAVCDQWTAWCRSGVRDGWSAHQRSGDGREHIHEFQRGRDSGSAIEFGLDAGRDIVTRSGQSGFHGSFFEFIRNSALDARNFDHPSIAEPGRIPPFRRDEFGFTNGGPVVLPTSTTGAGVRSTLGSIRCSGRCLEPHRFSPCRQQMSGEARTR